ncbi:hypothetical protein CPB86DRAFT_787468 [Serendipita vermifera]|nr:hypothetical protein CPB86DRAFT_787468 [Serendipita vermifera]
MRGFHRVTYLVPSFHFHPHRCAQIPEFRGQGREVNAIGGFKKAKFGGSIGKDSCDCAIDTGAPDKHMLISLHSSLDIMRIG